jgi:hypothetical protein
MTWKKRGEALEFKFEKKGESLTGKLIDIKTTRYETKSYTVLTAEGESYYFFGCYRLDSILPALRDRYIRITYIGKKKIAKGQSLRDYNVEVWKTEDGTPPEGFEEDIPF